MTLYKTIKLQLMNDIVLVIADLTTRICLSYNDLQEIP